MRCGPADRRRRAYFLLSFFVFVILLMQSFIIVSANHDCIGNDCPICKLIHAATAFLENLRISVYAVAVSLLTVFVTMIILPVPEFDKAGMPSLIGAVRLNN